MVVRYFYDNYNSIIYIIYALIYVFFNQSRTTTKTKPVEHKHNSKWLFYTLMMNVCEGLYFVSIYCVVLPSFVRYMLVNRFPRLKCKCDQVNQGGRVRFGMDFLELKTSKSVKR